MRYLTITLLAAALLLVGCGEGGDGEASEGESLQEYLGLPAPGDDPEATRAHFEEQQRQQEEAIAECMADQGFEYVPREPTIAQSSSAAEDLSPEEFREEYGFGISTRDAFGGAMEAEEIEDPNQEILEEMEQAEREAYQEALHGAPPEPVEEGEATQWEPGGCQQEAREEAEGAGQRVQDELGDEMQAMYERVQSDPRIVEAEAEWAACMRDAGWDVEERNDVYSHISDQMNELLTEAQEGMPEIDPEEVESDDFEPPPPPEPDPDALAELQEEELDLAEDEWECQTEHFGEDFELQREVQAEYEAEFIEEHRDVLEEIRDS